MTTTERTEKDVLQELSSEERALLKRVLEIERSRLHVNADMTDAILTDAILAAVRELVP